MLGARVALARIRIRGRRAQLNRIVSIHGSGLLLWTQKGRIEARESPSKDPRPDAFRKQYLHFSDTRPSPRPWPYSKT